MWSINHKEWKDSTPDCRVFDEFAGISRENIVCAHRFAMISGL
jgi:hypothetical protein